jgi:hypothetical protein
MAAAQFSAYCASTNQRRVKQKNLTFMTIDLVPSSRFNQVWQGELGGVMRFQVSKSITDLKALGDKDLTGARKFPAAPAITKSTPPSSFTHFSTAD